MEGDRTFDNVMEAALLFDDFQRASSGYCGGYCAGDRTTRWREIERTIM